MKYKASIFDVLQSFVNQMTYVVTIYKVTNSGTTYTLNVNDVYWAVIGATVTIGGNPYVIKSWNEDYNTQENIMQLVVNGNTAITATSFTMYPPFFAHGTITEEANQLNQQNSVWNKYPLIWAREGVSEDFNNDREVEPERTSDLTIYFLTNNNPNLPTENIYELYVRPMTRLKDNFIKALNTEVGFWPIGAVDRDDMHIKTTEITKVGVTIASKKETKNLFVDNLSGIAIEFKMKLQHPEPNIYG